MAINRRSIITGLISFVAAPAIVRVESLMKLPRPEKIMTLDDYDKMCLRLIEIYEPTKFEFSPIQMFWFDNIGNMHVLSVKETDTYLRNLDDYS